MLEGFRCHWCPLHLSWIPAPYQSAGRAFARKTQWGRRVDVGGGIAVGVISRDVSAWIPAFAGMTNSGGPELWLGTVNWHRGFCHALPPTPAGDKPPHYISPSPPLWIPAPYRGSGCAFAGKTKWGRRVDVGGGIAVGVISRDVSAWIPAFAGMTNGRAPE